MNEIENNYLKHHGILNQKWGKRNGPPYPLDKNAHSAAEKKTLSKSLSGGRNEEMYDRKAKKKEAKRVTKQLNKADKALAFENRELNEALERAKWYDSKIRKKETKGKKVSDRLRNKSEKADERLKKEMEDVIRGEKEINNILDSIDPKEFSVRSEETYRNVKRGSEYVAEILAAGTLGFVMPALGAPVGVISVTSRLAKGTEYKVKAKTDKEKARDIKNGLWDKDSKNVENAKNSVSNISEKEIKKLLKEEKENLNSLEKELKDYKPTQAHQGASETEKEYLRKDMNIAKTNIKLYEDELRRRR